MEPHYNWDINWFWSYLLESFLLNIECPEIIHANKTISSTKRINQIWSILNICDWRLLSRFWCLWVLQQIMVNVYLFWQNKILLEKVVPSLFFQIVLIYCIRESAELYEVSEHYIHLITDQLTRVRVEFRRCLILFITRNYQRPNLFLKVETPNVITTLHCVMLTPKQIHFILI